MNDTLLPRCTFRNGTLVFTCIRHQPPLEQQVDLYRWLIGWMVACLIPCSISQEYIHQQPTDKLTHSLNLKKSQSALLFGGRSFSKEIEHLYNRRTDNEKEEKGNQALADRVFVLVFSSLSHWNISTLGNILVKL